jgi:hypothetical protein
MTARSALMQMRVRTILIRARAKASLSLPSIYGRRGYLCTDRATLQDEASLYRDRQRSNFTVQAQRCERAREALEGMASNSEDAINNQKEKQILSRARQIARSKKRGARNKDSLQDGVRWTGYSQHGTAGSRRGIWDT